MYRSRPFADVAITCSLAGRSHSSSGSPTQCAHPSWRLSTWTNETVAPFGTEAWCGAYPGRALEYSVYSWSAFGESACWSRIPGIRSAGALNGPNTGTTRPVRRLSTVTREHVSRSARTRLALDHRP